jgi:hypothetical protein
MGVKFGAYTKKHLKKIEVLQNSAIRTISNIYGHTSPAYKALNILKLKDSITLKNCLLIHDFMNKKLPESFNNYFILRDNLCTINTRNALKGHFFMPEVATVTYGRKAVKHQAILSWNYLIDMYPDESMSSMSRKKLTTFITKHFISSYSEATPIT